MTRLPKTRLSRPTFLFSVLTSCSFEDRPSNVFAATLLAASAIGLGAQGAIADSPGESGANSGNFTSSNATLRSGNGQVEIDNNSFNIRTGPLDNNSNIPLPSALPEVINEGQAIPVDLDRLAPSTIEISPDVDYIRESLDEALDFGRESMTTYTLDEGSLDFTTEFRVNQRRGGHDYGEGFEVTVTDEEGSEISSESVFVQGGGVTRGPNNERLRRSERVNVNYGATDTVNLRVLNLRRNGGNPRESGIYFTEDGDFIVEDFQNGGDRDFNDGEYAEISGGSGEAQALEESREVTRERRTTRTPLDPIRRQEGEGDIETDVVRSVQEMDAVSEELIDRGEVEVSDPVSNRLAHSRRARSEDGEILMYIQYAAANEVRAGSDGIGLTGQLAPLVNNPSVPPTLLTGNLTFNPFVDNNEAGLTGTVGLTQFLTPTHKQATDGLDNAIVNPRGGSRRLLEPTGLFNNRQIVGYVPAVLEESVLSEPVSSINGIFDLPSDQPVFVAPPEPQQVGRGNAAYTDNVGGLLIEGTDGALSFVPQWTNEGYAQDPLTLSAGEASRLIYALVPQQPGQALQLGQSYAVNRGPENYNIADGGFTIISADRQPENFVQESAEVYAVEDTLPGRVNTVVPVFNGIRGVYAEEFGGVRVPTLDVGLVSEVDARVGNTLYPLQIPAGNPGQGAYAQTTVAAGLYIGGSLTGGLGNREDTFTRTETVMEVQMDELRTTETINTFEIPRTRIQTVISETTTITQQAGTALFDINRDGELTNARFFEGDVLSVDESTEVVDRSRRIREGRPVLIDSETTEEFQLMDSQIISADQTSSTRRETSADFAPVQGELALGGVLNFGNTPWTPAANTLRAELFARDTVFGRQTDGSSDVGWRTEVVFHPFGEVRREAFQYDAAGNVVPVYQTQALLDASGKQVMETLTDANGNPMEMPVNEFMLDESGELMAQMVGTGQPKGPGVYLRVEDAFDDGESVLFAGGVQFSF